MFSKYRKLTFFLTSRKTFLVSLIAIFLFKHSPWDFVLAGEDMYNNWTMWKDIFFAAVNDCIPKYKQRRKTTVPWITKDVIKLCRKKRNLYKKAKTPC